jgi:hypothetical protein
MTDAMRSSDVKQRLLQRYLQGETAERRAATHQITHRPDGQPVPLSLSQEQVWLHSEENADIPQIYTESITIYRNGSLDVNVLKQSLREILRRHESWRTSFEMNQGQLRQVIGEATEFPLTVVDLRGWPAGKREREATQIGDAQAKKPFDLRRGPLARATVVSLGDQQHRLYIDMHQIITDGVSVYQILPTELASLYDSFLSGNPTSLPELTWQFADYAAWQREWLQGAALEKQLRYWRDCFAIQSLPLHWPNDHTRPAVETHQAKVEPFAFSWEALDELQKTRKRAGISLFAGLIASFAILLHSYSQQDDIVLGTLAPCGRHHSEFQNLLGYFMNPVPLRFRVSGAHTFRELMLQAQEVISGAISHADVPFEHVVRALGAQPVPARHPLFQIAISLAPAVAPLPPGWDMTPTDVESGGGRWDLYIEMSERREHLLGRAQYNPDLFTVGTITKLLDDFQILLQIVGRDPQVRIAELPAFTERA